MAHRIVQGHDEVDVRGIRPGYKEHPESQASTYNHAHEISISLPLHKCVRFQLDGPETVFKKLARDAVPE